MKPSIPKGTRDFSPSEMVKRNYIFDTIRQVFKTYGYLPIETPSMENLDTLMGKYGEEGDKLIFKILNSGDYLDSVKDKDTKAMSSKELTKFISEKALRYDLTVPFARYVVQHQNDITFPFKRYQIQPVWRADRPQKGRYREFYQCDADVIGSNSLLNEVELIEMIDAVFNKLEVPVIIKINNRKILQGIAEAIGAPDRMLDIATTIDKVDKIGVQGVREELLAKGFTQDQYAKLWKIIEIVGNPIAANVDPNAGGHPNERILDYLVKHSEVKESLSIQTGVKELRSILEYTNERKNRLVIDLSLARGLNYYTGGIIEVQVDKMRCKSEFTSSICGGGRYDDLTGVFGKVQGFEKLSGVGISFGADRIYDVIEELGKFPADVTSTTKVLFMNFGDEYIGTYLKEAAVLRNAGITVEVYPDKINPERFDKERKKQFEYAEKKGIPYAIILGEKEMEEYEDGIINLKTIGGDTKKVPSADLIKYIV